MGCAWHAQRLGVWGFFWLADFSLGRLCHATPARYQQRRSVEWRQPAVTRAAVKQLA